MRRHEVIISFPYRGTQLEFAALGPVTRDAVERMIEMMTISLDCFEPETPQAKSEDEVEV